MQELTVAYRQNDLHTLLRLEMQWIENEGGDIDRLTEEELGVYNEVLQGQVQGLEQRLSVRNSNQAPHDSQAKTG